MSVPSIVIASMVVSLWTTPISLHTLTRWQLGELDAIKKNFSLVLLISIFRYSHDNAFQWMPQDLTDKSTLVQVMAWCRQATSHYLSQCWLSSLSSYGIARPQWVNCQLPSTWQKHTNVNRRLAERPWKNTHNCWICIGMFYTRKKTILLKKASQI